MPTQEEFMPDPCLIICNEVDVESRLNSMGIATEELEDVLRDILLSINSLTDDHPSWGKGITVASEAVASLRSRLREKGWVKKEEKGFALTVHPANIVSINIAKGDEGTGDRNADVISVSEKGICTEVAVKQNQLCFGFFNAAAEILPQTATWYLLYNQKADGLHAELSLPIGISDTRHLSYWRERIILPIIKDDSEIVGITSGFDDGGFKVSLSKKA